jgi:hypothetical protein
MRRRRVRRLVFFLAGMVKIISTSNYITTTLA